jgi:muramoyltetrapeptide carboxypeptidase LdcA involved in peptidoglycan recycling
VRALAEAGLPRLPVLAECDFGHTDPMVTLPYGAMAEIDANRARLSILEAGVTDAHG